MMFNHITISYDPCYEPSRKGEKWTDFEDNGLLYELQNNLPISVFNINKSGNLLKLVSGDNIGTKVHF